MKKWLKILLSLNSLRKAHGNGTFFSATKFNFHIEILEDLSYKKVLVLAPHPDDDIFGCGGTIKKLTSNGDKVTVVYFCDGSGGVKEGDAQKFDQKLIDTRKKEAKASAEILGIAEQFFFGYRDGVLAGGVAAIKALSDLIKRVEPDIIFVPSFIDNHPDHKAVNEILTSVLSKNTFKFPIWAYEVWTPLYANRIVMINKEKEAKAQAILAHTSQLNARGYEKAIFGLNQYRAEMNAREGFAEGFFASTPEVYMSLYQKNK